MSRRHAPSNTCRNLGPSGNGTFEAADPRRRNASEACSAETPKRCQVFWGPRSFSVEMIILRLSEVNPALPVPWTVKEIGPILYSQTDVGILAICDGGQRTTSGLLNSFLALHVSSLKMPTTFRRVRQIRPNRIQPNHFLSAACKVDWNPSGFHSGNDGHSWDAQFYGCLRNEPAF